MRMCLLAAVVISCNMFVPAEGFAGNRWNRLFNRKFHTHQPPSCTVAYNDQEAAVICMNRPVPPGWIIVGVRHSPQCNGLGNNSWVIQKLPSKPGAELIVCQGQPIPPGWAIIHEVCNIQCGHVNALLIRKISSPVTPLPRTTPVQVVPTSQPIPASPPDSTTVPPSPDASTTP